MLIQLSQPLLSGFLMGGIYGLIAFGLSLVFGVMRVSNYAHGDLLMIAMYLAAYLWNVFGIQPYISIIIVGVILFAIGFLLQKTAINTILKSDKSREPIRVLLFTAGLSIFLQNIALMIMGGSPQSVTTNFSTTTTQLRSLIISYPRLLAFIYGWTINIFTKY